MMIPGDCLAALGVTIMANAILATAQNMSYRADSFYHNDNVTLHLINFKDQYRMTIAGNPFSAILLVVPSARLL